MAATAISLHLRTNRHRLIQNPNLIHLFSSSFSSSDDNTSSPPPPPPSQPQSLSSLNSYFNDVKARLKQSPPPQQHTRRSFSPSHTNASSSNSKGASFDEIQKNLAEYRSRTTAPPPNLTGQQQNISFQELYKRNVSDLNEPVKRGLPQLEAIQQSLNQRKSPSLSVDRLKESFNWGNGGENSGSFIKLSSSLERGMGDKKPNMMMPDSMNMKFLRNHNHKDMGAMLRKLRPEVKGKNWFSLTELNDRLKKLREMESEETDSKWSGTYKDLKHSLAILYTGGDKAKKSTVHKLDVLGQLGGTPDFMLSPPQEHLVEKYFHPDYMSSGEKLKIELKKVRDEFKMSESDCGSARVVVAQLTTKIKHLSSVLHKKDKHSRKGLQGMVQQRKKLLKYLRRTDWDSYCFVLSRLGLRDNPDYKS